MVDVGPGLMRPECTHTPGTRECVHGVPVPRLDGERGHYSDGSGLARGVSRRIGRCAKVRLRAEVPDPHTNSQNNT